jgi:SNARE protein 1
MRGLVTEIRARDPTAADAYSKRVDRVHTALQLGNSSSASSPAYVTNGGASTSRQEWRPYKPPPAVVRRRAAAAASAAVTSPNANANVVGSSPSSRRGEGGVKISQSGDAHLRRQRETQEQLTDEMLELAGGIKANSLAMERSLLDSKRELDAVEGSLDKNLAGVKNERRRQKAIYETNRKGGCWTWIVLIAVGLVFTWVVLYMRFTHDRTRFKVR